MRVHHRGQEILEKERTHMKSKHTHNTDGMRTQQQRRIGSKIRLAVAGRGRPDTVFLAALLLYWLFHLQCEKCLGFAAFQVQPSRAKQKTKHGSDSFYGLVRIYRLYNAL